MITQGLTATIARRRRYLLFPRYRRLVGRMSEKVRRMKHISVEITISRVGKRVEDVPGFVSMAQR